MNKINKLLENIGRGVGRVVGAMYQAGRDSIDQVIKNVLPFMAFISLIVGIREMKAINGFHFPDRWYHPQIRHR